MMAMSAITRVSVGQKEEHPLFGEQVISVELEDEGGGGFFILRQDGNSIRINLEEFDLIAQAARMMLGQEWVRKHEEDE